MNIYYDKDSHPQFLDGKKIAIIGYGSQGHAHANNLRDSGHDVVVGLRPESSSWAKAKNAGLKVAITSEAASVADIVMMTLPAATKMRIRFDDFPFLTASAFSRKAGSASSPETSMLDDRRG